MGLRMQPRNEKFSTRCGKAGSNVVESAAILMGVRRRAARAQGETRQRLHRTEHAGDDIT